jgi:hypothetical protein
VIATVYGLRDWLTLEGVWPSSCSVCGFRTVQPLALLVALFFGKCDFACMVDRASKRG